MLDELIVNGTPYPLPEDPRVTLLDRKSVV